MLPHPYVHQCAVYEVNGTWKILVKWTEIAFFDSTFGHNISPSRPRLIQLVLKTTKSHMARPIPMWRVISVDIIIFHVWIKFNSRYSNASFNAWPETIQGWLVDLAFLFMIGMTKQHNSFKFYKWKNRVCLKTDGEIAYFPPSLSPWGWTLMPRIK